jgi:hypothetical protein
MRGKDELQAEQTDLCRNGHTRYVESTHVSVPLRLHQEKLWRQRDPPIHRHGLAHIRNQMQGRVVVYHDMKDT